MTATAPTASVLDELAYVPEISPTASVSTVDDEFVVDVEAHGFHADELEAELVQRSLHVIGHASPREELLRPDFEFWFTLPARADEQSVTAAFEDGVLTIRTALSVAPEERAIAIEAR